MTVTHGTVDGIAVFVASEANDAVIADLYGAVTKICGEDSAAACLLQTANKQLMASGRRFSGIVVAHASAQPISVACDS